MKGTRVQHISELWGDDGTNGGYCPVTRDVVEHEDGTITVSPSILVSDNTGELYHGFLVMGEW
ncbi:MAG TPA: hypothetical protein VN085_11530 [Vicinamibacterales bacterium]|nr:hypothetical protein [Vicinamibacterales bacterium]